MRGMTRWHGPDGGHWPGTEGGSWEGGCTDATGQRWHHVPNVGWQPAPPHPFLSSRPRRRLLKPSTWRSR